MMARRPVAPRFADKYEFCCPAISPVTVLSKSVFVFDDRKFQVFPEKQNRGGEKPRMPLPMGGPMGGLGARF